MTTIEILRKELDDAAWSNLLSNPSEPEKIIGKTIENVEFIKSGSYKGFFRLDFNDGSWAAIGKDKVITI